jgi:hypothetical protein
MAGTSRQLEHELVFDRIDVFREGCTSLTRVLKVSFKRTIRVSDNNTTNSLPPSLGNFPMSKVSSYSDLPSDMKAKGGYFLPMHRQYILHLPMDSV